MKLYDSGKKLTKDSLERFEKCWENPFHLITKIL